MLSFKGPPKHSANTAGHRGARARTQAHTLSDKHLPRAGETDPRSGEPGYPRSGEAGTGIIHYFITATLY